MDCHGEIESKSPAPAKSSGHLDYSPNKALGLVDDAETQSGLSAIRTYWRAFLWCLFCSIGAVLWGFDVQIGSGLLSVPSFRRDFGYNFEDEYVVPARWQSALNSASSIGGMLGGLAAGWVANWLGGVTTGSINLWIVVGQFMANCVVKGVGSRQDRLAYRIPFAMQWVCPALLAIGLPFAPESPWHLLRRGDEKSAKAVLVRLSVRDPDAELRRIQETIRREDLNVATSTYADCFRGTNRRRTIIALMVFCLQQFVGVIFVVGFSTYFFQLAGIASSDSFKIGLGNTALGVIGNLAALQYVNRFGRRTLFWYGMIGCSLVNNALGIASLPSTVVARWVQAGMTLVYALVYQGTVGPLGYIIFSEVGQAKLRSKTIGIGICVNSLAGMLAHIAIPYLVNPDEADLGGKVGFIFGGLGTMESLWTRLCIPETKNRTVEELNKLFEAKISPRKFEGTSVGEL